MDALTLATNQPPPLALLLDPSTIEGRAIAMIAGNLADENIAVAGLGITENNEFDRTAFIKQMMDVSVAVIEGVRLYGGGNIRDDVNAKTVAIAKMLVEKSGSTENVLQEIATQVGKVLRLARSLPEPEREAICIFMGVA